MLGRKFLSGLAVSVAILALAGPVRATAPDSAPPPATGRVFYVSPDGRDSNDGRSFTTAWRTVNYAVDLHSGSPVAPGDTVVVLPGTYTEEVWFSRSGQPQASITLKSLFSHAALLRPPVISCCRIVIVPGMLDPPTTLRLVFAVAPAGS